MAEMLATVAILIILMGVIFVGLINYQKLMAQAERDGYAKQIFIAAQNHLTMARGEGYLQVADKDVIDKAQDKQAKIREVLGNPGESGKYYFVVNNGDAFTGGGGNKTTSILDQMLPFGAVDETIRLGGSYIIEYDPDTATVFNVFYCSSGSGKFDYNLLETDYTDENGVRSFVDEYNADGSIEKNNKDKRRNDFHGGKILGWYGGAGLDALEVPLKAPTVTVDNGDVLKVTIKDNNDTSEALANGEIKLFITGKSNGARRAIHIKSLTSDGISSIATDKSRGRLKDSSNDDDESLTIREYTYILDDITTNPGNHFCNLGGDSSGNMIAGDDIEVKAVSYSSTAISNIAYSDPVETNSLYESIAKPKDIDKDTTYGDNDRYAYISSIRHLENLDMLLSNTGREIIKNDTGLGYSDNKVITNVRAYQTADLDWDDFKENTKGSSTTVYTYRNQNSNGYYPVNTCGPLIYDGLRHAVSGITVNIGGDEHGGLFGVVGATNSPSAIKNLKLKDFDIEGGDATGALAGLIQNTTVYNVIAYNTKRPSGYITHPTVRGNSGGTGGLVGSMIAGSAMKYCGAALVVQGGGGQSAGGLVGSVSGSATIYGCYSAGHTDEGTYFGDGDTGDNNKAIYNVSLPNTGSAGGLVGQADNATITNCYSTCSVKTGNGGKAGGLVGSSKGTITNCYSTGLVSGDNAFIGNNESATISGCKYLEIINEVKGSDGYSYKGSGASDTAVTAIDKDVTSYDSYVSARSSWNRAFPYDPVLRRYYHDGNNQYLYNFKTVTQLEKSSKSSANSKKLNKKSSLFVNTHYGDWPAPEIFIINGSSSGSGSDDEMWGTVTGVTVPPSGETISFSYKGVRFTGKNSYDWSSVNSNVTCVIEPNTLAYYKGQLRFFKHKKTANNSSVNNLFGDTSSIITLPGDIEIMDKSSFNSLPGHKINSPAKMNEKTIIYVDQENRQVFLRTSYTALTYPYRSMNGWTDVTDRFQSIDWASIPPSSGDGEIVYNNDGYYLELVGEWEGHKSYDIAFENKTGKTQSSLTVTLHITNGSATSIGGEVSGVIDSENKTITVTYNNGGRPIDPVWKSRRLYMVIGGTNDLEIE